LDPPPPSPECPPEPLKATCEVVAALAVLEPLPELALTIPNAPPATASAAAPAAIHLVSLVRKNMPSLLWSLLSIEDRGRRCERRGRNLRSSWDSSTYRRDALIRPRGLLRMRNPRLSLRITAIRRIRGRRRGSPR
jgi:hypothetical protein